MRDYEIVWILGAKAADKEGQESAQKVRGLVDSLGGKVQETKPWGKRNLAYPIQKNTEGFYLEMSFAMEPDQTIEFERAINADRDVIRHLIVKKEN